MVTIDLESSVPIEEQLRRGIRQAIARAEVLPGQALPSVRQLAGDLGIHWNTVARAYRRLRDEGLLEVGRGRRVTVRAEDSSRREGVRVARARIREHCRELLTEGRLSGLSLDEVERVLRDEIRRWPKEVHP